MSQKTTTCLICVGVLSLVAGAQWHQVFGWSPIVWRLAMAVLAPLAIAVYFDRRWPQQPVLSAVVSLVLMVWFLAVVVVGDPIAGALPSAEALRQVDHGLIDGWAQILSLPLPVPATGELLVLPLTLVWLSSLAGAALVIRTRWPLTAALPPVGAYVVALLFGIGGPGPRLVLPGLIVATAVVMAGSTAFPTDVDAFDDRTVQNRRRLELVGGLGVVVVVAVLIGPSLPFVQSGAPYDPRASRVPPELPQSIYNPLDELSVWANAPKTETLFTVRTSDPAPLRLSVLNQYDPVNGWTESSRFAPAGTTLPPAAAPTDSATDRQEVHIKSLPGPWLAAASRPVALLGPRALVDPSSGVLIASQDATQGFTYTVESTVSGATHNSCRDDSVVSPAPDATFEVPPTISQLAAEYTQGSTSPCMSLNDLLQAFQDHYSFSASSPSGSSAAVLDNFVQGSRQNGGGTGTSEQFASSFALMAASLDMNVRVVVGFFPRQSGPETYVAGPGDATAWVEVQFQHEGWVPFFPNPRTGGVPPAEASDEHKSILKSTPSGGTPAKSGVGSGPVHQALIPRPRTASATDMVVLIVGTLVGVLLLMVIAVAIVVSVASRRRRRRRRNARDPRRQVMGAWEDSLESLADIGVRSKESDTARELVSVGAERLGDPGATPLHFLGSLSNQARFSSDTMQRSDAETAWVLAEQVDLTVRQSLGRWGRIRRSLDPRRIRGDRSGPGGGAT
jgi:transglutaminase-like putative cysteine protease